MTPTSRTFSLRRSGAVRRPRAGRRRHHRASHRRPRGKQRPLCAHRHLLLAPGPGGLHPGRCAWAFLCVAAIGLLSLHPRKTNTSPGFSRGPGAAPGGVASKSGYLGFLDWTTQAVGQQHTSPLRKQAATTRTTFSSTRKAGHHRRRRRRRRRRRHHHNYLFKVFVVARVIFVRRNPGAAEEGA